jgi:hypothetical protein
MTALTLKALPAQKTITKAKIKGLATRETNLLRDTHEWTVSICQHGSTNGDVARVVAMAMDMGRTANRADYLAWLVAFTPIRYKFKGETKILASVGLKKGWTAEDFDLEGMVATPFWEFADAEDKEDKPAKGIDDLIKSISGYDSEKKFEENKVTLEAKLAAELVVALMGGAAFTNKLAKLVDEQAALFAQQEQTQAIESITGVAGVTELNTPAKKAA